jgi:hypothetical protein
MWVKVWEPSVERDHSGGFPNSASLGLNRFYSGAYRPMHRSAIIRETLSRQGLSGADLEAAVLAYQIANNLPLDNAVYAEAMARNEAVYCRLCAG